MRTFVIMPFDDEFTEVYELFLKPNLEAAGFEVYRSDDIRSQRNILQDIVESLATADLIVADLTGSNENVFYELGLAHALNRPVLLLTQDLADIPFDLQSYRLVLYSTHFARIDAAAAQLKEYAEGFTKGEILFGNPIKDYLPASATQPSGLPVPLVPSTIQRDEADDERGFLDHALDLETGYEELLKIITEVGTWTSKIGQITERVSSQLSASESAAHARKIARSFAKELTDFTRFMDTVNDNYNQIAARTENSLEFIILFWGEFSDDDPDQVRENIGPQLTALREMVDAATGGRDAFRSLAVTMQASPRIERQLTKALNSAAAAVDRQADNIEQTLAASSRAIQVGDRILRDLNGMT